MAKGYWIAHVEITDPERYKDYVKANAVAFAKFNARFLVRGGAAVSATTGDSDERRHVVLEFESFETAMACLHSPEYQAAAKIRDEASKVELLVVEGYDG